jgi:subtilisin family serine protease
MPDTYTYFYGGQEQKLEFSDRLVVLRTKSRREIHKTFQLDDVGKLRERCTQVGWFPQAGVEILLLHPDDNSTRHTEFEREHDVAFAGKVLIDPASSGSDEKRAVVYTENLYIRFKEGLSAADCEAVLAGLQLKKTLTLTQRLGEIPGGYFVRGIDGWGTEVFDVAKRLLEQSDTVERCHPEIVIPAEPHFPPSGSLRHFEQQWYLKKVEIDDAWPNSTGKNVKIAMIDNGFDIDHEEFAGKLVSPLDVRTWTNNPRGESYEWHGTECAGVACGAGKYAAAGVARDADLIPIRCEGSLGSRDEAMAFVYAALEGADIISFSRGPTYGRAFLLPDMTRDVIDWVINQGCIIVCSAGNDQVDISDPATVNGYAAHPDTIAVAATDHQDNKCTYTNYGDAILCSFPSGDGNDWRVWSTDMGGLAGYARGDYAYFAGRTSTACAGVAGVVALIIEVLKDRGRAHTPSTVREIIKRSCQPTTGAGIGEGRVSAKVAVEQAMAY